MSEVHAAVGANSTRQVVGDEDNCLGDAPQLDLALEDGACARVEAIHRLVKKDEVKVPEGAHEEPQLSGIARRQLLRFVLKPRFQSVALCPRQSFFDRSTDAARSEL